MAFSAPIVTGGQVFTHNTGGTSDAYDLVTAPAVGEFLRLQATAGSGGQGISAVSQPGVRWRQDFAASAALRCDVWSGYCHGLVAVTAIVTVTTLIAGTAQRVNITRRTGSGTWPGVSATNSGTNTNTLADTGALTTLTVGENYHVVACARVLSATAQNTPSGGFTALTTNNNGYYFAEKILTSYDGSAVQCTWVIDSVQWEAAIVAVRQSASSTITDANDALMLAFSQTDYTKAGRFKSVRDMRMQALTALEPGVQMVTSHADRVNDYRGSGWGATDMTAGAATTVNGATQVGTPGTNSYLHFDGTQWQITSATHADNDLSGVTGQTVVTIGRATANGGLGGIVRSATLTTAPYITNSAASGKYGMASSGLATIDTAVTTGSTIRVLMAQRYDLYSGTGGMTDISSGDQQLCAKVGGRMGNVMIWGVGGGIAGAGVEYASGNNFEVIGRQAANFVTGDVYWQAIISGMITQTQMAALEAFATAQFAAVMDNGYKFVMGAGASFEGGYDDSAVQLADPPMTYAMGVSTGPLGTLTARGYDPQPFAVQRGIPGRTLDQFNTQFAAEIAPHVDRTRPGRPVIFIGDVLYNSGKTQTLAQMQASLATLNALCVTANCYFVIYTNMSGFYEYSGGTFNPAVGPSAAGTIVLTLIAWLNSSAQGALSRCVGVQNYELDTHLKVDEFNNNCIGVQACADTAYYGVAGGHFINAGYQYIGTTRAQWLGANPGALDPTSGGVLLRRRRRD